MPQIERYVRMAIVALVAIATFYFLWHVREVVATFLLGAMMAYLIYPLVCLAHNRGINRAWAIIICYLALLLIVGTALWQAIPLFAQELGEIAVLMTGYIDNAQETVLRINGGGEPTTMAGIISQSLNHAQRLIYRTLNEFLESLIGLMESLLSIVFAPILAYYLILDWDKIKEGILGLFHPRMRGPLTILGREIDQALRGFVQGHLIVCLIVGILTGITAALLGSKYGLIIGLICGVTELLPYLGPVLGALPAIGLTLSESPRIAMYLGVAMLVIQQVESNILSPRIIGSRVGLHPVLTIFALLAGAKLFGIWGIIFGVPMAAVARILFKFGFYQALD